MSRIILKNLLNLTEQAPQAPMPDLGAPVAAPVAPPPAGMNAGQPDQQQPPTPETPEIGPQPEDPNEYDFTKDFREFEDKKNKAEAEAKKVVLDKMNEKLLNKTITANASRGYGQPKTDYTIENIKKVSVEFWYKDYVVIAQDENEKKYFLTPGINVKIEGEGSEPAPAGQEAPGQEAPGQQAPGQEQPQAGAGEEAPNQPPAATMGTGAEPAGPPVETPPTSTGTQLPSGEDGQPAVGGEKPSPEQTPQPQQTTPQDMGVPQMEIPPKKKKKVPVAEFVQRDLNTILGEFMLDNVKNDEGMVNFIPYIKKSNRILAEVAGATKVQCQLLIPENHMTSRVDLREIRLAAVDIMREKTYYGQYSKGYINLVKNGKYYLLEYVKEVGWNS